MCVCGGAISPQQPLPQLSPAPPTSGGAGGGGAGLQVMLGSCQEWSQSLSSKCPFQLAIGLPVGFPGASPPGKPRFPSSLSSQPGGELLSPTSGSSEQTWGPGHRHSRLATPMPLQSYPLRVPPHQPPGSGTRCCIEDLPFKHFFKLSSERCDQNSISKASVFLCTGVILMNSSFLLRFVQPTEAAFSNVFHPQKQKQILFVACYLYLNFQQFYI